MRSARSWLWLLAIASVCACKSARPGASRSDTVASDADATSLDASAKAQPMSTDPTTAILDHVDPFWYDTTEPVLDEAAMKSLASLADPAGTLLGVVTSADAPLGRRYVAIEALVQGGWTDWMKREDAARAA